MDLHEVYQYQVIRYDPQTGKGGLFAQYINAFLKLKAEASGNPSLFQCPEEKDRYISDYNNSEGIQMDKDAIGHNPAKRGLAKLCLNSMWGKLPERNARTRKKMITDLQELYRFLATPGIEVANILFASNDVVLPHRGIPLRRRFLTYITQTRLSVPTSRPGRGFICTVISTRCGRERCIVTPTLFYTYSLMSSPTV